MENFRIFLDTETTGLSPHKHQILIIGIVITDNKLNPVFEKEYLIRKELWSDVNPVALRINKINLTTHNIRASSEKTVCKRITRDIRKHTGSATQNKVIGHNLGFDMNFLGAMFERHEIDFPFSYEFEDTMYMAKGLIASGNLCTPNAKLGTLCKHFDYKTGFHNALNDTKATVHLYEKLNKIKS
ncbi:MAG: 3'-5' exonuclease [Candidatus Aenigmarchaeota archaeon]|nr:3'-5' exonuclease [Candidatus Aenigmarchaeota archaeon]